MFEGERKMMVPFLLFSSKITYPHIFTYEDQHYI